VPRAWRSCSAPGSRRGRDASTTEPTTATASAIRWRSRSPIQRRCAACLRRASESVRQRRQRAGRVRRVGRTGPRDRQAHRHAARQVPDRSRCIARCLPRCVSARLLACCCVPGEAAARPRASATNGAARYLLVAEGVERHGAALQLLGQPRHRHAHDAHGILHPGRRQHACHHLVATDHIAKKKRTRERERERESWWVGAAARTTTAAEADARALAVLTAADPMRCATAATAEAYCTQSPNPHGSGVLLCVSPAAAGALDSCGAGAEILAAAERTKSASVTASRGPVCVSIIWPS